MRALRLYQSAIAALFVLLFWSTALFIPATSGAAPVWLRAVLCAVGVGMLVSGAFVLRHAFSLTGTKKGERVALATVLLMLGSTVAVAAVWVLSGPTALTSPGRFAFGVGGAALAGFAYATTQFDSIRAAASVPVVVLLVGVVVWPDAGTLVSSEVRQALITWMGVILAVNGTAEAAKQVGESVAKAKAGNQEVRSGGDLAASTAPEV